MFAKHFTAALAFAAATILPAVTAQIVDVPLGVTLDLGNEATCPADAPPGTDVDATVLAVVTLDAVADAELTLLGLGLVGATIDFDIDVCLCIDATVDVPLITLPVNLEAPVIEDLTSVVDGLDLGVVVPGVGTLSNLLGNGATDVTLTTTGRDVNPCTCPPEATPICSNATCSCDCPAGFFYNPVTQECVLAPSAGLVRRRAKVFDSRQAKRAEIVARLLKA